MSHPYMSAEEVEYARQTRSAAVFEQMMSNVDGRPEDFCPCVFFTGGRWQDCPVPRVRKEDVPWASSK